MEVIRNGKFNIILSSKDLSKGLRKESSSVRDVPGMSDMSGLVSQDGVLQAMEQLSRINTDIITDDFPYPQIFILSNHILICGAGSGKYSVSSDLPIANAMCNYNGQVIIGAPGIEVS